MFVLQTSGAAQILKIILNEGDVNDFNNKNVSKVDDSEYGDINEENESDFSDESEGENIYTKMYNSKNAMSSSSSGNSDNEEEGFKRSMLGNDNRLFAAENKFARRSSLSIMKSEASEVTKYSFTKPIVQVSFQEHIEIDEEDETRVDEIVSCCTTLFRNGSTSKQRVIILAGNYTVWAFHAFSLEMLWSFDIRGSYRTIIVDGEPKILQSKYEWGVNDTVANDGSDVIIEESAIISVCANEFGFILIGLDTGEVIKLNIGWETSEDVKKTFLRDNNSNAPSTPSEKKRNGTINIDTTKATIMNTRGRSVSFQRRRKNGGGNATTGIGMDDDWKSSFTTTRRNLMLQIQNGSKNKANNKSIRSSTKQKKKSKKMSKRSTTIHRLLNDHDQHQQKQDHHMAMNANKNVNFFVTASIVLQSCNHKTGSLLLRDYDGNQTNRKKKHQSNINNGNLKMLNRRKGKKKIQATTNNEIETDKNKTNHFKKVPIMSLNTGMIMPSLQSNRNGTNDFVICTASVDGKARILRLRYPKETNMHQAHFRNSYIVQDIPTGDIGSKHKIKSIVSSPDGILVVGTDSEGNIYCFHANHQGLVPVSFVKYLRYDTESKCTGKLEYEVFEDKFGRDKHLIIINFYDGFALWDVTEMYGCLYQGIDDEFEEEDVNTVVGTDTNMRDANVDRYINNNDGYDKYENAYITSKK